LLCMERSGDLHTARSLISYKTRDFFCVHRKPAQT
jgi:hypothetical protein